jgi:hypothetical protein
MEANPDSVSLDGGSDGPKKEKNFSEKTRDIEYQNGGALGE